MRLVLVEWIDAQSDADQWATLDELHDEPRLIRTAGYLLPTVITEHTTVASSWDETTDTYGSVMHIPDDMVLTTVDLRPRKRGAWR